MIQKKIWYSIYNCGDGSAGIEFLESKELSELAQEFLDDEASWAEDCSGWIVLESESEIFMKNVTTTKEKQEELEEELSCYEEDGEFPETFKRIAGHLNAIKKLIAKKASS